MMHRTLIEILPSDLYTTWYRDQAKMAIQISSIGFLDPAFQLPVVFHTSIFRVIMRPDVELLILYCRLLAALTDAIVENAYAQGSLNDLRHAMASCLDTLQDNAPDRDIVTEVTSLGSRFIGPSDVLEREYLCMLWVSLYLCAPEVFSRHVIAYFDTLDVPPDTWYHYTARVVYNISPAVREVIQSTLKPFLLPEWKKSQASVTTQKHMANLLHYFIRRTFDAANAIPIDKLDKIRDLILDFPSVFVQEFKKAFRTGNLAAIKQFCDLGEERTACLFGLYHLAGQDPSWTNTWIGVSFLSAALCQTPQCCTVQLLFNSKEADENEFAHYSPAFALFNLPQASGTGPADPEQARIQSLLRTFGLWFYDQSNIELVRIQAEIAFRECLPIYKPASDVVGGALAATCFLAIYMQTTTLSHTKTMNALTASENAREALQRQHNSLQKKSQHQESYADEVTRANAVFEGKLAKLQQQNEDLQAEAEDLRQQINQLLDLLDKKDEEETPAEAEIPFPADISPCTAYLFGGHPDFQTKLRQLIPDLRMAEVDQRVDKQAIANADMVFLQAAHISHSMFYTVMGVCKANSVPVVYLTSTSAKRAAVQIVEEIERHRAS